MTSRLKKIIVIFGSSRFSKMDNMKMFSLFFVLLLFASCQPKWDYLDLVGDWNTVSWVIDDSNERIENQMDFSFKQDKTYKIDYGTIVERGKYWLETDYLVTVEEGQYEKKVKILNLTRDSFEFRMNRAGRYETVLLVK